MNDANASSRRKFLSSIAMGTSVASLGIMPTVMEAATPINTALVADSDEWFKKGVKGTHRIVYDGSEIHAAFPIIWTWAFYFTNNQTGTEDNDMTGVCVLRHGAVPLALNSSIWKKYKLGETFSVPDKSTKEPALRNPYYEPKEGDMPMPGIQGIKDLQGRGAMFCACELALSVYSGVVAKSMGMDPETVKKDWMSNILPGVQVVPSGVWALGRAQELDCGYIYAGG